MVSPSPTTQYLQHTPFYWRSFIRPPLFTKHKLFKSRRYNLVQTAVASACHHRHYIYLKCEDEAGKPLSRMHMHHVIDINHTPFIHEFFFIFISFSLSELLRPRTTVVSHSTRHPLRRRTQAFVAIKVLLYTCQFNHVRRERVEEVIVRFYGVQSQRKDRIWWWN